MAPVFTSLEMLQPRKEVKIAIIGTSTLIMGGRKSFVRHSHTALPAFITHFFKYHLKSGTLETVICCVFFFVVTV